MASNDVEEPAPPKAATVERHRALVAESIDRAIEESCVLRDELIDLAIEFDDQASVLDALAHAKR